MTQNRKSNFLSRETSEKTRRIINTDAIIIPQKLRSDLESIVGGDEIFLLHEMKIVWQYFRKVLILPLQTKW